MLDTFWKLMFGQFRRISWFWGIDIHCETKRNHAMTSYDLRGRTLQPFRLRWSAGTGIANLGLEWHWLIGRYWELVHWYHLVPWLRQNMFKHGDGPKSQTKATADFDQSLVESHPNMRGTQCFSRYPYGSYGPNLKNKWFRPGPEFSFFGQMLVQNPQMEPRFSAGCRRTCWDVLRCVRWDSPNGFTGINNIINEHH
jgi:hypothetical protein